MKQVQIDHFFKSLDEALGLSADIIILGASAASLMGFVRPSFDIDFEIRLRQKTAKAKKKLEHVILEVSKKTGIAVNYSENVAGWSQINYLDYRRTAAAYKKFGKLNVNIIAPEYWTIGKMTRFLELDIQDMEKLIRGKKIPAQKLIKIWAKAVNSSDLSLELGQFKDHVLWFIDRSAKKVWGKTADPARLKGDFLKAIG